MAFPASERGVAAAKPQTTAACLPPAVAGALHLFVSKAVYPALCGGFLVLLLPGRGLFHHDASLTRLAIVLFMVSAAVMYHLAIRSDRLLRRLEGRPDARASKGSSARRSVISWNSPPSTTVTPRAPLQHPAHDSATVVATSLVLSCCVWCRGYGLAVVCCVTCFTQTFCCRSNPAPLTRTCSGLPLRIRVPARIFTIYSIAPAFLLIHSDYSDTKVILNSRNTIV